MNTLREDYTAQAEAYAFDLISEHRVALAIDDRYQVRGMRFNDNETVFHILASLASEQEFEKDPVGTVTRALNEAAHADYWYANDKEYDHFDDSNSYDEDECEFDGN